MKVRGYEKLWFIGDNFVFNSFNQHYYKRDHEDPKESYCKYNYEVVSFMSDAKLSIDNNILSRMQNLLVGAMNQNQDILLPKLIVIVLDADLAHYICDYFKKGFTRSLGKAIDWLMHEHNRAILAMKDLLPHKAKKAT